MDNKLGESQTWARRRREENSIALPRNKPFSSVFKHAL
jgi:hypothetical protein